MKTNTNRNLAKGFLPVLLLSAALSLPAVSVAAPAPNGKAHAADKANKNHEKHVQKAQKEARKAEQHAQKAQRQAAKAQQKQKVVVVPQRVVQRPVVVQRQVTPQRRVVVQKPVVVQQPVYVAQRNNRNQTRAWDGWNRRYSKYGSGFFQLDGTFVDQQAGCVLVRDHQGQVIPLVGNPGDLRRGEHLLLSGRIQNNTSCGTAFRVETVDRVWADTNHRRVLFDRRQDGEYYDQSGGRYGRYDDRYEDRSGYDPDGRRSIAIDGRLDDSGDCPVVRGDRGEYYDLVGDLSRFQDGRHVRVVGRDGIRSSCGGPAIEVTQILYR